MRFDFLANILFPPLCVACGRHIGRGVVCEPCFSGIAVRAGFLCGECHAPVKDPLAGATACHPDFPYILGAATDYADKTVQSLVHHLKFRLIPDAAEPLAELVEKYLARSETDLTGFVAIPIPLSTRRLRARGYNQAELIAQHLAKKLKEGGNDLPIASNILIRAKHSKPQSDTTSAAERRENIHGVYAIRDTDAARASVRDANILLIDDVSTSGATFFEASRMLKAAGAGKIIAIAVAKT